jgi:hypothetical protein
MRALAVAALLLLAVACGETAPGPADAGAPEAGPRADAAPDAAPDAGALAPDAGPGEADAGDDPLDADVTPDATFNGDFERDPTRVTLGGACRQEERLGGFQVQLNETLGYTALDGVVRDGVIPAAVRDVVLDQGGCRLLRRRRLVCDPPCGAGQTCGLDETCVPSPVGRDMGAVRVLGLARPLELRPQQPGNTYFFTRLPHPGVQDGDVVQLTAPAPAFFAPLELYGVGVRQLVPLEQRWVLTRGEPLVLHWVPPAEGARTSVFVELNIDLHGLTPLILTCDLPDTGTGTIAASVIEGLIGAGVTGFPEARVARRTADRLARPEGCVDFTIASVREVDLEVTGFVPCTRTAECPPGLTCDVSIQQCR